MSHAASLSTSNAIAEPMAEMNMTPLIDVMLVLIIMLIITIPRQNHTTSLSMPTDGAAQAARQVVDIEVDFDGTILWNGEIMLSRAELSSKLLRLAQAGESAEVHIRPNKLAPYKTVAAVMAAAQRSGVLNMGMVGNEQFM